MCRRPRYYHVNEKSEVRPEADKAGLRTGGWRRRPRGGRRRGPNSKGLRGAATGWLYFSRIRRLLNMRLLRGGLVLRLIRLFQFTVKRLRVYICAIRPPWNARLWSMAPESQYVLGASLTFTTIMTHTIFKVMTLSIACSVVVYYICSTRLRLKSRKSLSCLCTWTTLTALWSRDR